MLIVMKPGADAQEIDAVVNVIQKIGLRPHSMPGATRTAIGITGNQGPIDGRRFENLPGGADDFRDPGQIFETPAIDWTLISGHAYRGARGAGHRMRTEPDCLNDVDHCIDIARSGARFHYNQHFFEWVWVIFIGAQTHSPWEKREKNQRPLSNGRFLSPSYERRDGDKPAICCLSLKDDPSAHGPTV